MDGVSTQRPDAPSRIRAGAKVDMRLSDSNSEKVAIVAVVTGDRPDERYITLVEEGGSFQRWKLSELLAKKVRREFNQRLD